MARYRVDNIPFLWKPFFLLYSYGFGMVLYLSMRFLHFTCRFEFIGEEHLAKHGNFIICLWHENLLPYLMTFVRHRHRHIWLNHPAWYMKPIHVLCYRIGVEKLILGSTGHSGKAAADQIVEYLTKGCWTMVACDGPYGPAKELKKGALHMAKSANVPILPLRILTPRCITLNTWDKKRIPLPFSKIRVVFGTPMWVDEENIEQRVSQLTQALG